MTILNNLLTTALCSMISISAFAGGTTAGGGGIAPEQRITQEDIHSAVRNSKLFISSYINAAYNFEVTRTKGDYCDEVCTLKSKILRSNYNLFEALKNTKIEVRDNDFCYDNLNNKKDGSVYSTRENAICISSYSLVSKLNITNYQNQVTSLVFHELTHLAGTSEDEAVALQNNLLAMLTKSPRRTVRELSHKAKVDIDLFVQDLEVSKDFLTRNSNGTCMYTSKVFEKLGNIEFNLMSSRDFNLVNPIAASKFYSAYVKTFLVKSYLCANDNLASEEDRELEQMRIENVFGKKSSVSTASNQFNYSKLADKNVSAKNITNSNVLNSELTDITNLLTEVMNSLSNAMVRDQFEII